MQGRVRDVSSNPERTYSLFEDTTLLHQIIQNAAHLPDGRRPPFTTEALTRVYDAFTAAVVRSNGVCRKTSTASLKKRYDSLRELHKLGALAADADGHLGEKRRNLMNNIINQQLSHDPNQVAKAKPTNKAMAIDFEPGRESKPPQPDQHISNPQPAPSAQVDPDASKLKKRAHNPSPSRDKPNTSTAVRKGRKLDTLRLETTQHPHSKEKESVEKSSEEDVFPLPQRDNKVRPDISRDDSDELRVRKRMRISDALLSNGTQDVVDRAALPALPANMDNDVLYRLAMNAQKITLASADIEKRRGRLEADRMRLDALRMERDEAEREERLKMLESWKEVEIARVQAEAKREEQRTKLETERLRSREDERKTERKELERLVRERERAEMAMEGWRAEVERHKWEMERARNDADRRPRWRDNNHRPRDRPSTPRHRNASPRGDRRPGTPARSGTPGRPGTPGRSAMPSWSSRRGSPPKRDASGPTPATPEAGSAHKIRAEIPRDANEI